MTSVISSITQSGLSNKHYLEINLIPLQIYYARKDKYLQSLGKKDQCALNNLFQDYEKILLALTSLSMSKSLQTSTKPLSTRKEVGIESRSLKTNPTLTTTRATSANVARSAFHGPKSTLASTSRSATPYAKP